MATLYPAINSSGTITSFLPLTTIFTPSIECSRYFRLNGPSLVAFDPGYGLDINSSVRCAPSAVTTWWEQGRLGDNNEDHTALSLGPFTCPYQWSTVVSSVENQSSTHAMCCPSGYYLANGISGFVVGDCLSDVSSGMTLTYASTSTSISDVWYTETTTLARSSVVGAIAIVGWNINLATPTEPGTTSKLTTEPSKLISTRESIAVSSSSLAPSISSPSPSSNNSSRISQGAAAGIGVGVGVGVIGIASLLVTLYVMKKRKKRNVVMPPQSHQGYGSMAVQQPLHELYVAPIKHELDNQPAKPHELPGEL
ncbi:hypothetical protein F5B22DRAFT_601534 [Xylaria bambusicola]|uniref:uncharacterized protein n=1 Tax=Xylaria bambusicola TaxID=326684 RepID=UPI0020087A27|nr:uncharacterized protein F5B22DRAFT_601534 [Xylaria bambusicola]KAI0518052.1 hypothetical protein F5B22DRAFT_601534 [Xylaria bambusicola]